MSVTGTIGERPTRSRQDQFRSREEMLIKKTAQVSALTALAFVAAFWAYVIIDSLLTKFSANVTFIDLGAIFVLGLIAGIAAGLAFALRRKQAAAS